MQLRERHPAKEEEVDRGLLILRGGVDYSIENQGRLKYIGKNILVFKNPWLASKV